MRRLVIFGWLLMAGTALSPGQNVPAPPKTPPPGMFTEVRLDQKLGTQVPLDLAFRDEAGRTVTLGQYAGTRPLVLSLVYYECPMLCTEVLNGMNRSFQRLAYTIGTEFDVVTVSIDPREGPELAMEKKSLYLKSYTKPGAEQGWHFLTGDEPSIRKLAEAVGFNYVYDEKTGQYAHPAGIMVLTPQGKVARYLYGVDYPYRDLSFALIEASSNRIGSAVDKILMLCYEYDPMTGKYGVVVKNLLRIFGGLLVLVLGGFMFIMFRRDRQNARRGALAAQAAGSAGQQPIIRDN